MSNPAVAKMSDSYRKIANRLSGFRPPIFIDDHIGSDLEAGATTLGGITFTAKDSERLLTALRDARDWSGQKAFAEGSKEDTKHWALSLSFAATEGIGFREIWRPRLSERPLRLADARPDRFALGWSDRFAARFEDSPDLDLSSLHCAIAVDRRLRSDPSRRHHSFTARCNIHIDEVGFVMTGPEGEVGLDPDFLRHTLVELLLKSKLEGKLPSWARNHISLIVPSSPNRYSRWGLGVDILPSKAFKLTLSGSCTTYGKFECSGILSLSGNFGHSR